MAKKDEIELRKALLEEAREQLKVETARLKENVKVRERELREAEK